jgi:hypothetical protein
MSSRHKTIAFWASVAAAVAAAEAALPDTASVRQQILMGIAIALT